VLPCCWQVVGMRELTLQQLAQHDGSDPSLPMLLSIRGVVYDITSGKQFYGPDGEQPAATRSTQQQRRWQRQTSLQGRVCSAATARVVAAV
jgi:hypothetical protein